MHHKSISEWSTIYEEALTCWIIENNKTRWIREIKNTSPNEKVECRSLDADDNSEREDMIQSNDVSSSLKKSKSYQSKYTTTRCGNAKYKSWNQEGIKKYNCLIKKSKNNIIPNVVEHMKMNSLPIFTEKDLERIKILFVITIKQIMDPTKKKVMMKSIQL